MTLEQLVEKYGTVYFSSAYKHSFTYSSKDGKLSIHTFVDYRDQMDYEMAIKDLTAEYETYEVYYENKLICEGEA